MRVFNIICTIYFWGIFTIKILRDFPVICTINFWGAYNFSLYFFHHWNVISLECNIIYFLPLEEKSWLLFPDQTEGSCGAITPIAGTVGWSEAPQLWDPSQPALCGNLPQNRKNATNKKCFKFDFEYRLFEYHYKRIINNFCFALE